MPEKETGISDSIGKGVKNKSEDAKATSIGYEIDKAVNCLLSNAKSSSTGRCATHLRLAIKAGGIDITTNPVAAKDYGPYLLKYNFRIVSNTDYLPLKGDIAVIQPYKRGSSYGYITMFDGENCF